MFYFILFLFTKISFRLTLRISDGYSLIAVNKNGAVKLCGRETGAIQSRQLVASTVV